MQDDSPNGVEEDARGGGKDYTTTVLSQSVGRSCDTQAARKAENCFWPDLLFSLTPERNIAMMARQLSLYTHIGAV